MKILMVSIFAPHFFNWTAQLEDSGHEVYWLDVNDSNTQVKKIDFVNQIYGWRNKIKYPGRYWVKHKKPKLYKFINRFNQRQLSYIFESKIQEIKPDVVHSFVMYSGCVPIYEVMQKYPKIKWIYSAWGNDLYFYQNESQELQNMKRVLPKIDFMFADCYRDFEIAKVHGFRGKFLGVFPGGGGYDFKLYDSYITPFSSRKLILIKGYQHKFGRCNKVLEAISQLRDCLVDYEIVVFAANKLVLEFSKEKNLDTMENVTIYKQLPQNEVLKLMGKSKIFIGNSISDGMPNTLLEAIIMGSFPIQSNPGGASKEIIDNGINGLLIINPEDVNEIKDLIKIALANEVMLNNAFEYNLKIVKPKIDRNIIKQDVLRKYSWVEMQVNNNQTENYL